jgi:hypothetical protein
VVTIVGLLVTWVCFDETARTLAWYLLQTTDHHLYPLGVDGAISKFLDEGIEVSHGDEVEGAVNGFSSLNEKE